jgi:hypothetical protein
LSYDSAWEAVLAAPLVWESDLKGWIKVWQAAGQLEVQGLGPRERVPKLGQRNMLAWTRR